MFTESNWTRIKEIFSEAIRLSGEELKSYLDRKCGESLALRKAVEHLLSHYDPNFLSTPERIGSYSLVVRLGEGGMGIVYLAEQLEPVRRPVALKVIRAGMDTREVLTRFRAEQQALALMSHPGIAKVFEAGTTFDGRPYFAMQLVAGQAITDYCDQKRLQIRQRLRLFAELSDAVEHAHQRSIIHRDLKPTNVLVSEESGAPRPIIIDFGISKSLNGSLCGTMVTLAGEIVGTPAYMSPEQADPAVIEIDTRADIYALGVILHDLLVGEPPLDFAGLPEAPAARIADVQRRLREMEPPKPSDRLRRLPQDQAKVVSDARSASQRDLESHLRGDLDWIVLRCLEKDRERRYASASLLAADIRHHLDHEPVSAGPPSKIYRMRKLVRKHRALVSAVAAVLVALTIGLASTAWFALETRTKLEEVLRLSDLKRLQELRTQAEGLWPPSSEKVAAMEDWLRRAKEIASRRDLHKLTLEDLRRSCTTLDAPEGSPRKFRFESSDLQWQHDALSDLVSDLEPFLEADKWKGVLANVEWRLDFARTVRQKTIDDCRSRWDLAIRSIADSTICPAYGGLRIEPQEGLVPLGRDPESGLWEFAHLFSGELDQRGQDGKLGRNIKAGIVLVLLPGGTFVMGGEQRSKAGAEDSINVDPLVAPQEGPCQKVTLKPFFLSKYEMSQGQWWTITGQIPSKYRTGRDVHDDNKLTASNPVESVSWDDCERTLENVGLMLPTEAQWEYGTRAGTRTPWWSGDKPESLSGAANMADVTLKNFSNQLKDYEEKLDDKHVVHAAIGTFRANPFGLHDTMGNVAEWCREFFGNYWEPRGTYQEGDAEHILPSRQERVVRGGSFMTSSFAARSAYRVGTSSTTKDESIGVRPARPLTSSSR